MYVNEALLIDFLANRELLWLGINFTKARFTRQGLDFSQEILQHYFHDWNMLIINDQKKYDIRMSFRKPIMQYDLSTVTKANKTIRPQQILAQRIDLKHLLSEDIISEYIQTLTLPTAHKYALTLMVESFDTSSKTASIWVVITTTETKEIVLCEKFIKNPCGFGTRNYWARTFYDLFYDIKTKAFIRWEHLVKNTDNQNNTD